MSLLLDVHNIEGRVSAEDVAAAHQADLETQNRYGVSYLRYWLDEEAGKFFCLVEADSAGDANTVVEAQVRAGLAGVDSAADRKSVV
jgi:hypothetical protein